MKYRGYYTERHSVNGFHSAAEIDSFITEKLKEAYRRINRLMFRSTDRAYIAAANAEAFRLQGQLIAEGVGWDEIEALELEAYDEA